MLRKIILTSLVFIALPGSLFAQVGGYGIPSTYDIADENVQSGDIISFNPVLNIYDTSQVPRDETMFGVVDTQPVVVFRSSEPNVPVVQVGEVLVNVTDLGGPIAVGDEITSSRIAGKGQKLESGEGFILGLAMQSFDGTSSTTIPFDGNEYGLAQIRVLLSIGPSLEGNPTDNTSQSTIFVREEGATTETGLETVFRYMTAAIFALGTIFFVFKAFGPNIGKGVVSVGRNPLAKTSIQAMVVFNMILILSISIVGFAISLLIIFLPI